ncbi:MULTISPECIES: F0F1 ATP synthase subunit B [unclassified Paenibacillus]|uniref:F0F1 ATP synthase subunit B n=1 Tax=unclassified Paenibacillus TaxID=185978 RepID=UPI001C105787|nr:MULTISPECIES: F0F1 ATP synthase subunit B [unclassified Paenibacillus]MBU5441723.1 F0F1 ATP synthase subunit B [Paenibacillus sp. MSJ-34]CAH0118084.1 ATP synthase subunit b [Paenibacillus sp. CECT 9249]
MNFVPSSTVFTIIAFLILYFLLNKYAFGPLFSIMEKRKERVLGELQEAEQSRKQAEALIAEQKEALQQARKDAYEIIEQSKTTSTKQAEEIIAQAKEEANRLKDEAVREIESEKNKAVTALRSQVSGMSVMIASKIIEKQIDEKSQEELVDHYLKEVGEKQ